MFRTDNALSNVHIGGACVFCLNPNNVIDTEKSIPYEGVIAICLNCVKDLAECAGFDLNRTAEEWEATQAELVEANYIADSILAATTEVQTALADVRKKHRDRLRRYRQRAAEKVKADA